MLRGASAVTEGEKKSLPTSFWVILGLMGSIFFILVLGIAWEERWLEFSSSSQKNQSGIVCKEEAKGSFVPQLRPLQVTHGSIKTLWSFDPLRNILIRSFLRVERSSLKIYDQQNHAIFCDEKSRPPSCISLASLGGDATAVQLEVKLFQDPYFVLEMKRSERSMYILGQIMPILKKGASAENSQLQFKRLLGVCGHDIDPVSFAVTPFQQLAFTNRQGLVGFFDLQKPSLFHVSMSPGHPEMVRFVGPSGLEPAECKDFMASSSPVTLYQWDKILILNRDQGRQGDLTFLESSARGFEVLQIENLPRFRFSLFKEVTSDVFAALQKDWLHSKTDLELYELKKELPSLKIQRKNKFSFVNANFLVTSPERIILGVQSKKWFFSFHENQVLVFTEKDKALEGVYEISESELTSFEPLFLISLGHSRYLNLYKSHSGQYGWSTEVCEVKTSD